MDNSSKKKYGNKLKIPKRVMRALCSKRVFSLFFQFYFEISKMQHKDLLCCVFQNGK